MIRFPRMKSPLRISDPAATAAGFLRRLGQIVGLFLAGLILPSGGAETVVLRRVPDGGIQPQIAVDARGEVHLLYYRGESTAGDLFHVRCEAGGERFSAPVRVNREPGSAMAIGTIRGGQIAVGRNGRVHVAWNGHSPRGGSYLEAPMLYTRLDATGAAFEPERNLITRARGLDGGGSVAADDRGHVYVTWHAPKPGNTNGEAGRAVFVARSSDDGVSFDPERPATELPTGACGCCGMKAFVDRSGDLFLSYRAASDPENRSQTLLVARGGGPDSERILAHPWRIASCPMSSASFGATPTQVLAAWESVGNVVFTRIHPGSASVAASAADPISLPAGPARKHPVVVGNARGDVLLVWTEGTAWARGGEVAWQVFDAGGRPTAERGRVAGLPVWSLAGAYATPDQRFVILY